MFNLEGKFLKIVSDFLMFFGWAVTFWCEWFGTFVPPERSISTHTWTHVGTTSYAYLMQCTHTIAPSEWLETQTHTWKNIL